MDNQPRNHEEELPPRKRPLRVEAVLTSQETDSDEEVRRNSVEIMLGEKISGDQDSTIAKMAEGKYQKLKAVAADEVSVQPRNRKIVEKFDLNEKELPTRKRPLRDEVVLTSQETNSDEAVHVEIMLGEKISSDQDSMITKMAEAEDRKLKAVAADEVFVQNQSRMMRLFGVDICAVQTYPDDRESKRFKAGKGKEKEVYGRDIQESEADDDLNKKDSLNDVARQEQQSTALAPLEFHPRICQSIQLSGVKKPPKLLFQRTLKDYPFIRLNMFNPEKAHADRIVATDPNGFDYSFHLEADGKFVLKGEEWNRMIKENGVQ